MSPDTIHFKQERIFKGNHDTKLWHVRTNALEGEARAPGITASHHKIRGLRLKGHNHTFTTVEVPSLPYLLYGHNAATIHGISEIRLAYQLLDEILSEVAPQKGAGNLISSYSRLDAAFQFRYPTKQLFSLLQQYQFPGSRTPVKVFLGKSIRFDYKGLQVEFYDKIDKLLGQRRLVTKNNDTGARYDHRQNDVTRCEIRFKDHKTISEYFGEDILNVGPTPVLLTDAVRKVLYECFPKKSLDGYTASRTDEFLAVLHQERPDLYELYLSTRSRDTQKKIRSRVRKHSAQQMHRELNFEQLLPEGQSPEYVDIWPGEHGRTIGEHGGSSDAYEPVQSWYASRVKELRLEANKNPKLWNRYGSTMQSFQ